MPDSTSPVNARNGSKFFATRTHLNVEANDMPCNALDLEEPARRDELEYQAQLLTLRLLYDIQQSGQATNWAVANDFGYDSPYNQDRVRALIRKHPDLAPFKALLEHFAVIPYVRESRRIQGEYALKARDVRRKKPFQPVRFPTAVAIADYPVDVHGDPTQSGVVELDLDLEEDIPRKWTQWGYGPFQVPLESFIPVEIDGFLPAEKNLSQSRIVNGATRLQPSTMLTGQASGAIAGLAVTMNVRPRDVPALAVQSVLLDAGDTLSLQYYTDLPHGTELWKCVQLATLYNIIDYPEPVFLSAQKVDSAEIEEALQRLRKLRPSVTWKDDALPLNREQLARAIATALLELPSNSSPEK